MAAFSDFRFEDLFRSILQGSLTEAICTAERFAERSLHAFVRYLVDWYKSLLIQVAVGAALALVAAVALGSAITQGLVALGVAPWLAPLLLCVAAGAGAYFLIQSAGARFRAEPEPEEARGSNGVLDLVLQILLSRAAAPPPQSPPARKRKRRRKIVDVHPRDDDWEVSESGSRGRKKRTYRTQTRAVKAAKAAARKASAEVVIHGEDGRIRDVVAAPDPAYGEDRPI
jgi:hypothetical protein